MSANITNSNPRVYDTGVNDKSIVPTVAQPETVPIHLPLIYINAPAGKSNAAVLTMNGGDAERIYGVDLFNPRKKYFNHASQLAQVILDAANPVFLKRLTRPTPTPAANFVTGQTYVISSLGTTTPLQWQAAGVDGTPAVGTTFVATGSAPGTGIANTNFPAKSSLVVLVSLDSTTPLHPYQRDSLGQIIYDLNGAPTFDTTATLSDGITVTFTVQPIGNLTLEQLSSPLMGQGNLLYPLFSFVMPYEGEIGDQYGIKLWTAGPTATYAGDTDIINDQQALIFNAQIVTTVGSSTPVVVTDTNGVGILPFMLKPNAFDFKNNSDLTIDSLVTNWSDDGSTTGTSPTYSPVGEVTVYESNLETVLTTLLAAERGNTPGGVTPVSNIWSLDFLTGLYNYNGSTWFPAYGFQIDQNGALFTQSRSFMYTGGNDGDLSNATFEATVVDEVLNHYDDPDYPLLNKAKYPFSAIYDSGFSNSVSINNITYNPKKILAKWLNYRGDVHVTLGTHVYGAQPLTLDEEISALIDLHSSVVVYAESAEWGTSAFRAVILGQAGQLNNYTNKKYVSTVFALAEKRAGYFGAGDGKAKSGLAYNNPPNIITTLKNLTTTYQNDNASNAIWAAGGNMSRSYDMHSNFWPMIQTVYAIDNSVLTDEVFMQVVVDIKKQIENTWKQLSGIDDLTDEQFILKSNSVFTALVEGKYDGKAVITPTTYFTPLDTSRGYTWTMSVDAATNVARTVMSATIVSSRIKTSSTTTN